MTEKDLKGCLVLENISEAADFSSQAVEYIKPTATAIAARLIARTVT